MFCGGRERLPAFQHRGQRHLHTRTHTHTLRNREQRQVTPQPLMMRRLRRTVASTHTHTHIHTQTHTGFSKFLLPLLKTTKIFGFHDGWRQNWTKKIKI